MNKYGNESISALKGAERIRKRPSVIFGSDGIEGAKHTVFEILSNSIDEAREGYGKKIILTLHEDRSITIEDEGRGIPLGYNRKEKKFNWELLFTELYAGAKYNNNKDSHYKYSLGLNGLGLCATQYSSEFMNVIVNRSGKEFRLKFEKGENVGGLKSVKSDSKTGTIIHYKPDLDVFTDILIEEEYFKSVLKEQAVINNNILFVFDNEITGEKKVYKYEDGINDYIKEISENKEFSEIFHIKDEGKGRDRKDKPEYNLKYEMSFTFNNEINELKYFHNSSSLTYGGSPDQAVKTAFIYEIDKFLKKLNKYNKNEKMINFTDIEDSLILISSSFSTNTSYENQTKKSITNQFIRSFITKSLRDNLEIILTENPIQTEKILDQILVNKRSREKADITRNQIKKVLSKKIDLTNKVNKFVDCREKDSAKRELFIVEGDSALGACKQSRDSNFQALMPIRGKILNTLKSDNVRILKSDIIMDLIRVIGTGIELKTSKNSKTDFDLDSLRYSKIIITTDADVDGFQIRTLLLTMFYTLTPTLLKEGKIFIAETPLYEIIDKEKTYFAYNEKEKRDIVSKLNEDKIIINRSKGLGQNDPEMMWMTTMNPKTRKLTKIRYTNSDSVRYTFDALLGDDIQERKKIIEEKSFNYKDLLDLY